ncbi:hypothetical protein [Rhizobium vallis]|uniref:hypothetical protein n=1 Tax=Rhizobium vallis TaxID=634290 RepID=UPI0013E0E7E8
MDTATEDLDKHDVFLDFMHAKIVNFLNAGDARGARQNAKATPAPSLSGGVVGPGPSSFPIAPAADAGRRARRNPGRGLRCPGDNNGPGSGRMPDEPHQRRPDIQTMQSAGQTQSIENRAAQNPVPVAKSREFAIAFFATDWFYCAFHKDIYASETWPSQI